MQFSFILSKFQAIYYLKKLTCLPSNINVFFMKIYFMHSYKPIGEHFIESVIILDVNLG